MKSTVLRENKGVGEMKMCVYTLYIYIGRRALGTLALKSHILVQRAHFNCIVKRYTRIRLDGGRIPRGDMQSGAGALHTVGERNTKPTTAANVEKRKFLGFWVLGKSQVKRK